MTVTVRFLYHVERVNSVVIGCLGEQLNTHAGGKPRIQVGRK